MRGLGPMAVGERRDPRRALVQTGDMVRLHRRRPRRALDAAPSRFQTPCLCGYIHQSIFLMLYCAKYRSRLLQVSILEGTSIS